MSNAKKAPSLPQPLIRSVRKFPSRNWLEGYLDLASLLLNKLQIESTNQKLTFSIPKKGSGYILPVSINFRYVVAPCVKDGESSIGIIVGPELRKNKGGAKQVSPPVPFRTLPGEEAGMEPYFLWFRCADDIVCDQKVKDSWLAAARKELERAESSPHRRFHKDACCQLALNPEFRLRVLDAAFK